MWGPPHGRFRSQRAMCASLAPISPSVQVGAISSDPKVELFQPSSCKPSLVPRSQASEKPGPLGSGQLQQGAALPKVPKFSRIPGISLQSTSVPPDARPSRKFLKRTCVEGSLRAQPNHPTEVFHLAPDSLLGCAPEKQRGHTGTRRPRQTPTPPLADPIRVPTPAFSSNPKNLTQVQRSPTSLQIPLQAASRVPAPSPLPAPLPVPAAPEKKLTSRGSLGRPERGGSTPAGAGWRRALSPSRQKGRAAPETRPPSRDPAGSVLVAGTRVKIDK